MAAALSFDFRNQSINQSINHLFVKHKQPRHISSSLLLLSSHPAPAPLIRYTILTLYKFICMYVCKTVTLVNTPVSQNFKAEKPALIGTH